MKQLTQIEEWTLKKCGEIIFDSTKDNWELDTSTFDSKIYGRKQLLFIIEDIEGNKFGGYIDSTIDEFQYSLTDWSAFLFSLESNGRLDGMKKFTIKDMLFAFCLFNKSSHRLFKFGRADINIFKKGSGYKHSCEQCAFYYGGNQNTLCGTETFELKRFIVIQMN